MSGVILFDETLRQRHRLGQRAFPEYLARKGIIPGIKVDKGIHDLALRPEKRSPRGWTACGAGWRSTSSWARASPSGAR